MYDFIHKSEYYSWWDSEFADHELWHLKGIQDAWVMSEIADVEGLRICEVGGGASRVLGALSKKNECWNIDKFEGQGNGPKRLMSINNVKTVPAFLGDFDSRLPDDYFDVVFSISVIEHVVDDDFQKCFQDMSRVLKPGGRMLHAIDVYLKNEALRMPRVDLYRSVPEIDGVDLCWEQEPSMPELVGFDCAYASNSDQQMAKWNVSAPGLRSLREIAQSCSIKAAWKKPG